ncbi:hypothetical protein [Neobacillus sp. CF12]|uniref:hypothetical protein n=1 Tax=Neobacillus sp. CF12 TaxID=3055864 RepID=UPI0025A1A2E0|nr:hypothetical protein [Neobacillus sp. CF12]MDM5326879.1 hypothetical protein [Neobacillus sp. CF12]
MMHDNSGITTYNEQAYHEGNKGNTLDIPYEVSDNGGEELYRKHFEQGRKERNLKLGIVWLGIVSISIFIIYFYKKWKKALYNEQ